MTASCKNCENKIEGNYCSNCGQSTKTHRITLRLIISDLQNGLFSFETGFLYTLKQLFTRPGYSIKEYINGKRVYHYKPISLLILLSAVYLLLNNLLMAAVLFYIETENVFYYRLLI